MNALSGMTGFARVSGEADWGTWAWEAKSVNGRGLDIRTSYPQGFEAIDRVAKSAAARLFSRGSVQLSLRVELTNASEELIVNEAALSSLIDAFSSSNGSPPNADALATLMTVKGVVEVGSLSTRTLAENEAAIAPIKSGLQDVLENLQSSRVEEGQSLKNILLRLVDEMSIETDKAAELAGGQPTLLKERLEKQLAELSADDKVDAERLAAEIALSAAKADVREEFDRLKAHIETARMHLSGGSPIGRKLDFLAQELNREANTLCSKSVHLDLTNVGLTLKGLVDQFKEQAANVE